MHGVELVAQSHHVRAGQGPGRHDHRQFERLATVAEVRASQHAPLRERHPVAREARFALREEIREERLQGRGRESIQAQPSRGDELVAEIGGEHAHRRGDTRAWGHQHGRNAELARQRVGVQGTGASEGDKHKVAWIVAALYRDEAHRADHVGVGDFHDAAGRGERVEPEGRSYPLGNGAAGRVGVERHLAAQEERRIEPAQHEVRVGDGRGSAAQAVTRRPRSGPRAARPDAKRAPRVDPRLATPARTDLHQIDHRSTHRIAAAPPLAERRHRLRAHFHLRREP